MPESFKWVPVDIVVPPTILERFTLALVAFANDASIIPGKLYPCPLRKVKKPKVGQPYETNTVQRQTNDVLNGPLGTDIRKAHPELAKVHHKKVNGTVYWYRDK